VLLHPHELLDETIAGIKSQVSPHFHSLLLEPLLTPARINKGKVREEYTKPRTT
jgi:hypothetical protein